MFPIDKTLCPCAFFECDWLFFDIAICKSKSQIEGVNVDNLASELCVDRHVAVRGRPYMTSDGRGEGGSTKSDLIK